MNLPVILIYKVSLVYFILHLLQLISGENLSCNDNSSSPKIQKNTTLPGRKGRCFGFLYDIISRNTAETFKSNASSNPDDVTFFLYPDPRNSNSSDQLFLGDLGSIFRARIRYWQPFKFLIHGFTQSRNGYYPRIAKDAYLRRTAEYPEEGGYNIVAVDWEPLARSFQQTFNPRDYKFSVQNVAIAGKRLAEFIVFLHTNGAIRSYDDVHIVGYSLGAHVGGSAGKHVTKLTAEKLGRITGLDPAGPGYNSEYFTEKLQNKDAKFLDVYHTSMGLYGLWDSVGDAEFLPNGGGPVQPSCLNVVQTRALMGLCSHSMAPYYFALSIIYGKKDDFIAKRCDSFVNYQRGKCNGTALFGEFCNPKSTGRYYLYLDGSAAPHIQQSSK